jgi:endonuclease/exonuclease/phosphatase (EEP) superfamily protein YafD
MARLRILSANLLIDRADPEDLRRAITEVEPDVVATQELGIRNAAVLADTHVHGLLDPREDYMGLGIVATSPVEVERLELAGRSGWVAHLDPANWPQLDAPLDVLNIHLLNPVEWPWPGTRAARRRQIAQVGEYLAGRDTARVIVGDMNSTPAWPEYRMLAELGVDAADAAGTARRTWSHYTWGPRWFRIDHAFVTGVTPLGTRTVKIRGSDHLGLVVDIEV